MKNKWEEDFDNRFFNGDWDRFRRQDPHVIKIFIEESIQQALANERERIADEVKRAVIESTYIGGVTYGDELVLKIDDIINKEE